jgi:SAM-dependent methyltransferase
VSDLVQPNAAFDELARHYDAQFTTTALGAALRHMSWKRFERVFAGRVHLLDIGCGTGEDAIHLARRGHRVLATDSSLQMVRLARHKAELAGCAGDIRFVCAPMENLATELAGETFDGVYSNFGAMNCTADLAMLARDLAALLRPGAPLVWVVMGRYVPWEWAWYLARGDAGTAFRRVRPRGVTWRGLRVNYPSPAALARALRPHFVPGGATPLGFALPGSYAASFLERAPRLLSALVRAETVLQRLPLLAACADHYLFEARRQPA